MVFVRSLLIGLLAIAFAGCNTAQGVKKDVAIGAEKTGEALQKIAVFKGKPEAHLIVRVCLAIANADGKFDSTEQQALDQICRSLDLDIKTFV